MLLVTLAPVAWLLLPFSRDPRRHFHRWARVWAGLVVTCCRVRVDMEGQENLAAWLRRGPVVIACNHQSVLDIPILLAYLPGYFAFVSKLENFSIPILGRYMEWCGFIPLKRHDRARASEALSHAVTALDEGRSVLMFPEGTRSSDGQLGRFKRGALLLAIRAGVPILPVAIGGTFGLLPRHTPVARPGAVVLRVGAPYLPGDEVLGSEESTAAALDDLRNRLQNLLVRPARAEVLARQSAQPSRGALHSTPTSGKL